jgi:hypothetical protein
VDSEFEVFGAIGLTQYADDPQDGGYLYLTGAFHSEPFDPKAEALLETRTTPDGASCDIYMLSGMIEPEPVEPPQVDGGAIRAGNGGDWPDTLETVFDGQSYVQDWRSEWDEEHPLPGWLSPGPLEITFECDGGAHVAAFLENLAVSATPEMTAPGDEETVEIDEDDNYVFEWDSNGATEVVFNLDYNMDWDNVTFECRPAAEAGQILIPLAWIDELTWGGAGGAAISSLDEVELAQEDALVVLSVVRTHYVANVVATD